MLIGWAFELREGRLEFNEVVLMIGATFQDLPGVGERKNAVRLVE